MMGDVAKGIKSFKKGMQEDDAVDNVATRDAIDDKAVQKDEAAKG